MHRCKYGKPVPATNQDFWALKRRSNVDRDKRNRKLLKAAGWRVFEIWECQTRNHESLHARLVPIIEYLANSRLDSGSRQ
jgi:DNA mismatch endonuclease (patch repair protein)